MLPHSKEGVSHNDKTLGCTLFILSILEILYILSIAVFLAHSQTETMEKWTLRSSCTTSNPGDIGLAFSACLLHSGTG
jgi:hypothetical protein